MNIRLKKHLCLVSVLMVMFQADNLLAQNKQSRSQDTIDTQVVTIVKPYTPKISDAFKLKQVPSMGSSETPQKLVKYTIFSIPVASTFTPAKGTSVSLDKLKKEKLFQNYASLGYGNYGTILGNVYLNQRLSRGERIGGYIEHHSSQGGIDGLQLEDDFSKNSIQVNYVKSLKTLVWNTEASISTASRELVWTSISKQRQHSIQNRCTLPSNWAVMYSLPRVVLEAGEIHLRRFSDA